MADNYILQFAGDPSALVLDDGEYSSDAQRLIGNQPGIARADFVNKALRQTSYMATVLAQWIVDYSADSVIDSNSITIGEASLVKALSLTTGFPTGTKMVFYQANAPLHWTKDTTNNDMALRVVSGTGGGIGGVHNLSTPPSLAHVHGGLNHYHAFTGVDHTHSTAGVALTEAQMPQHRHDISERGTGTGGTGLTSAGDDTNVYVTNYTGYVGSSQAHYHGNTGAADRSLASTTSYSGQTNTEYATPTSFAPKYIDVIVCTKD
jgi:hypothetical protein